MSYFPRFVPPILLALIYFLPLLSPLVAPRENPPLNSGPGWVVPATEKGFGAGATGCPPPNPNGCTLAFGTAAG